MPQEAARQCVRRLAAAGGEKKKEKKTEKNVFLVLEIGAPGGPGRRGVLHPTSVACSSLFSAPAFCRSWWDHKRLLGPASG